MFHLKFFGIIPGSGHVGTLLAILFLGSVQLICTGLLGEYIGRIYDEVRRRPLFVIHKLHRAEAEGILRYKVDQKSESALAAVEDSVA